jgi:hypothetical protein
MAGNHSQYYGPREAMGGTVTADGVGHFNTGLVDDKVYGAALPAINTAWTGTFGAPSSSGRTVLNASALTGANGKAVLYIVDAGHLISMISDTSSTGRVFSGNMLAQQAGAFSLASMKGNVVAYQTANYAQPGYETLTFTLAAPDGAGNLPWISYDVNSGGNIAHLPTPAGYIYTVAANGQASIFLGSIAGGKWYLTKQNTGLMLGFDYGVSVGEIMPQSAAILSAASISGNYFASQAPGGSYQATNSSGIATSTGNGILDTTMDVNNGAFTSGLQTSVTLTTYPLVNGRIMDTNYNVIYVVSPGYFLMLNYAPGNYTSVIHIFEQ